MFFAHWEEFFQTLQQLAPFGLGNREPVFAARNAKLLQPPRIMKEKHLKLRIRDGNGEGRCFDALGWRMVERLQVDPLVTGQSLDVAFTVEDSSNQDFPGLQLVLRAYRQATLVPLASSAVASQMAT